MNTYQGMRVAAKVHRPKPSKLYFVERAGSAWLVRERDRPCDGDIPAGRIVAAFAREQDAESLAVKLATDP